MHFRITRAMVSALALLGALLSSTALVVATQTEASAATPGYYLSLGDSYSIGEQPGVGSTPGFAGYIAGKLGMQEENFGCGGATTTSMLDSDGCGSPAGTDAVPYSGTQMQAVLAFIAAHPGAVQLITMSIGGNDFDGCSTASCVQAAMPTMEANIKSMVSSLASALTAASDSGAKIIGLTYPDVDLGYYVYPADPPSAADVSQAQMSITAFDDLVNPTLSAAYQSVSIGSFVNVTSAPYGSATEGDDTPLGTTEQLAPYGTVPVAVGEICQLTYFCSEGNIHANTTGYTFIGQLTVAQYASRTPPTTAILLPATGADVSGGSSILDASASPYASSITFELTGGSLSDHVIATGAPTYYGWLAAWNTTAVPNGTYTLQSVASDNEGTSSTSAGVTITVDNTAPTTSLVLPASGATLSGSASYLDAVASAGVTSVTYELSGGPSNVSDEVIATATPTIYGWLASWNPSAFPNGTYTIQSVASYGGGLSGTSPGVSIADDALQTQMLLPKNDSQISGTVVFDASAQGTNIAGVSFEVTFGPLTDDAFLTATPTIYGWIGQWNSSQCPPGYANGTYEFQSVVTQAGGATATSAPVYATLSNSGGCP